MFIFGTAGHVDHGKTALIYALTSIDTDRLPEEKKREMTIDLGFAWLELKSGGKVGIIDVPGHEHFIKNMIVGANEIDGVILVVDANEGWMLQTEEHFQIIELLNLKYGIVALTKIDLVNEKQIDFIEKNIKERLKGTIFSDAPLIRVSAKDHTGIDKLKETIEEITQKMKPKRDIDKPWLAIDRIFKIKGSGTIVTGTLIDGSFFKGQEIIIFPSYKKARIRDLQIYKERIEKALPGNRVALNLAGIDKEELKRGDIILGTDQVKFSKNIDGEIILLPQLEKYSLKQGTELSFFTGTKEVLTRTILYGKNYLNPGETGFAQFRFKEPMATHIADHFILRVPSPPKTIGGGIILEPLATKHSFRDKKVVDFLQERKRTNLKTLILSELKKVKFSKKSDLLINSHYSYLEVVKKVESLKQKNELFSPNSWVVDINYWQEQIKKILNRLNQEYQLHPLEKNFHLIKFQSYLDYLPQELFYSLINYLVNSKEVGLNKGMLFLPSYQIKISSKQKMLISKILKSLKENPTNPPTEKELYSKVEESKEIIQFLLQEKKIIRLDDGILMENSNYQDMKYKIINFLRTNKSISIAQVRNLLGISRKYIVPLLSRMDSEGITKRKGNERILLKKIKQEEGM